eukprot:gene6216-12590_t
MDPLSLLRKAVMSETPVNQEEGYYTFESCRFHESTPTAFKKSHKSGGYYTLKDIIFFLENDGKGISEYRSKTVEVGCQSVVVQDISDLKEYLTGHKDTCSQIDQTAISFSSSILLQNPPFDPSLEKSSTNLISSASNTRLSLSKRKGVNITEDLLFDMAAIEADKSLLASLRSDEIPTYTRNTILMKQSADFSSLCKTFIDRTKARSESKQHPSLADTHNASSSSTSTSVAKRSRHSSGEYKEPSIRIPMSMDDKSKPALRIPTGPPIIIVPNTLTDFLSNLKYIPIEEKKAAGVKRVLEQIIKRDMNTNTTGPGPGSGSNQGQGQRQQRQSRPIEYKIIDDPRNLRSNDWEHVVAVFAFGQEWQFKAWKWSKPAELFQHALGVHVALENHIIEPAILSWNCRVLKIHPTKRYSDAGAVNEFWGLLDDFMKLHKPWLYNYDRMAGKT